MTNVQLYFAIGIPVFAIIMAMVGGMFQFSALSARFTSMENRFTSLETRFDALIGKVIEIDNRLTRVEALLERH